MAHIDEHTFEIWQECDVLTQTCTINEGDVIRVGCYAFWNGTPMDDVWIILRFMDYHAYTSHDVWLGKTNSSGWLAVNHTVTAADIADLGDNGHVVLQAHSDPKAWGSLHAVNYYRACVVGCEVSCESTCELSCQTSCELGCETGCELYCQTTCEQTCQETCQVACQYGCEISCETGCEISCETGCEISCETGCEVSCETAAEVPTKATDLLCYDATCESGESVTIKASLAEKEDPFDSIGGKTITFTIEKGDSAASIDATTDESTGLAQIVFPGMFTGELGDYALTAGFKGDVDYAASSCSAVLTVTEVTVKKDTVICDFDILDAAGNKVTDLVVGAKYKVRAWLCWYKTLLGIPYGGCAEILKGCDTNYEVSDGELIFVKADDTPIDSLKTGKTDVNGWGGVYWTPKDTDVGTFGVKLKFAGISGYNACESGTETITVTKPGYTINITVKDENGNPIEGMYVDIDQWVDPISRNEKKCTDSDVAIYVGECKEEEWKGDGYNVVTASVGVDKGKVSIGLPKEYPAPIVPTPIHGWAIRVGKAGYLNKTAHEDWTEEQVVKGAGTHSLEFALTFITVEDKFVVHTVGFEEGDLVVCQEMFSECWFIMPFGLTTSKAPDAYPNGKVEFTSADGLEEGKSYGFYSSIKIPFSFPTGMTWCGGFKGIRDITLGRYGSFGNACKLMGIEPTSDECLRFWSEMIDPVYCANCITGVFKGVDVYGNEYHPGKFELAMFPIVVGCSAIPFLPGAKITKFLGRFLKKAAPAAKYGDDVLAVRKYFEDDYLNIYRIQAYGDEVRLKKWADAIDAGDVTEARRWMDDILANPAVNDAVAVGNFNSWLDELTKQIDNIDPKQMDEIADLRARVLGAANACMDDVTDFTRVYDEKYTEFIDVARRGSGDKTVSTFVRAADCLCSPGGWHCKFSFVNALGDVTVGAEKVNLWDITAVLNRKGMLDSGFAIYNNIIKAFAHADESQIRALRLALEAENYDEVIRLLEDLPRVDMDGKLIARFFNEQRVKSLDKWADRADEILLDSDFLHEEIDEIFGIATRDVQWYRFKKTADTRYNLFINMLRNASRGPEVISPAGRSAFTTLSFNNGDAMFTALRSLSDSEYLTLLRKLGPETEEGTLLGRLKFLQTNLDDGHLVVPDGTDLDTWVRLNIRETISGISPSQYGGPWPELANRLTGEFPTMTPDRIVAECSMLTDDFKAAEGGAQWRRVRDAGVSKLKAEGYTTREAELLIEGKIQLYMKELTKKPFTWAIDHPVKAAGVVLGIGATAYAYVTFGFWIVWYYEELPQMTSMPMYMAVKNEDWLTAAEIWTANRATIGDLESKAKMVKLIWPLWADWLDTCIEAHKASNKAYLYMIDPSAPMPELSEGLSGHVLDVVDSDTIWSGMPDSKLEEMIEYTKAHDPQAAEPKVDAFIPPTLTIRFAGVNGPDRGDVGGYWIHRIATIGGEPEIAETTGDCYTNANTWTYTALSRKNVFILSDKSNQWETFRKGRICRFIGVIRYGDPYKYASEELIRSGWGVVYFHDANKQVSISEYLAIERTAADTRLGLWSPACTPCPATDVWFDYNPPPRVGAETTFYGWVSGCELSEITDWKWLFPGGATKEGRIVKHTFDAEWKGPIRLEICAGALTKSREVTVKKAYVNKASPCAPYGDVNGDGYVNDADAKLVSDYIDLGWGAVDPEVDITETEFKSRADVSKSGEVDISDVNLIYAYHAEETTKPHFPVCPDALPSVKNVKISASPDSPIDVGTTVTLVGTAETEAPYVVDSWTWKITDPTGIETTKSGKTTTHLFNIVGTWSIVLKACNNVVPPNCSSSTTKTMKVETYVPPPPKGTLTIKTYATRDFATADPLAVETFYIDDVIVSGTYSCSKTGLLVSGNPHKVKIDFKESPHTCYADKLDECFDTCEFYVDVVKDITTVIQVCPARTCLFISDPMGATIYLKPVESPKTDYTEIPSSHTLPLGTYSVKFMGVAGYGEIEANITIEKDKVTCENVITAGGHCYTMSTPEISRVPPGLFVTGFLAKALLPAAVTKTVRFESVPLGAEVTVLD